MNSSSRVFWKGSSQQSVTQAMDMVEAASGTRQSSPTMLPGPSRATTRSLPWQLPAYTRIRPRSR